MLKINTIKNGIYLLCVLFLLFSCGTRKRTMERSTKKVSTLHQKDIASLQTNDIVAITSNDISTDVHTIKTNDKVIFKAIDNSRPFYVAGKKYENVIVEKKFTKEVDSSRVSDRTIQQTNDQTTLEKKEHSVIDKKTLDTQKKVAVERDNSFGFWDWLWLLLAIVVVFFIVFKRKSMYGYILKLFKKIAL